LVQEGYSRGTGCTKNVISKYCPTKRVVRKVKKTEEGDLESDPSRNDPSYKKGRNPFSKKLTDEFLTVRGERGGSKKRDENLFGGSREKENQGRPKYGRPTKGLD